MSAKRKSCKLVVGMLGLGMGVAASAATINVACPGQSVQAAVNSAASGDTISVTGVCNENVIVPPGLQRLQILGNGTARLIGNSSTMPALEIRGSRVTVAHFNWIAGGNNQAAIHVDRGGVALIQSNVIQLSLLGVVVGESSYAVIIGNSIHNIFGDAIQIPETSSARIGFNHQEDPSTTPNTITATDGSCIKVTRNSSARIVGNSLQGCGGDGVTVLRHSQADISSNTINNNGGSHAGSGIFVTGGSEIELGNDSPTSYQDQPNITTVLNNQYGIKCTLGSVIKAHIGSSNQINGSAGQFNIAPSCVTSILP
jgi:hypothetical protein